MEDFILLNTLYKNLSSEKKRIRHVVMNKCGYECGGGEKMFVFFFSNVLRKFATVNYILPRWGG